MKITKLATLDAIRVCRTRKAVYAHRAPRKPWRKGALKAAITGGKESVSCASAQRCGVLSSGSSLTLGYVTGQTKRPHPRREHGAFSTRRQSEIKLQRKLNHTRRD